MNTPVWIGLGSNLGDRKVILDDAVAALGCTPGVEVRIVSGYHETRPVGGPPGQGAFLNAAAHLETTLDPYHLLAVMHEIENQAGRVRTIRWGERTLDLDILIFGTKFLDTKELKLPHPRLAFRRFVLAPLAEIAPDVVDTMTKQTISRLLANLDHGPRLLALDGPVGSRKSAVFHKLVEKLPAFGISGADLEGKTDQDDGLNLDFFEVLGRKAQALGAGRCAIETLRLPWIVTDYCIDLDLLRAPNPSGWNPDPQLDPMAKLKAYHEGMARARLAANAAAVPTIIVVLPSQTTLRKRPGLLKAPQLWFESETQEAIVDEALATCRSIDEV